MSGLMERHVVVVGHGSIGTLWADAISDFPQLVLDGVVEPDVASWRASSGTSIFASVEEFLQCGPRPDLALISNPSANHIEAAERFLSLGAHILVASPLTTTLGDAERLHEMVCRNRCVARSHAGWTETEALETAKRLLESSRIGPLRGMKCTMGEKRAIVCDWRADPSRSGGGVWMEYGAQALEVAEWIAGAIDGIRMFRMKSEQGGDVEDDIEVAFRHTSGLVSQIRATWNEDETAPLVRLTGEQGEILIGRARSILVAPDGSKEVIGPGINPRSLASAGLARFLCDIRRCEDGADAGIRSLRWIHAAYRSMHARRWETA